MNITVGLRRALQVNAQGIAILEGERKLTWAEVGERVARLAGALCQLGIKKGDRVAVLMLNSSRYLELYLAVGWAGAAIVPLKQDALPNSSENSATIAGSAFTTCARNSSPSSAGAVPARLNIPSFRRVKDLPAPQFSKRKR